jgi:hypothetical protein
LTLSVAISNIFKYKKEHGNISVPNKEPHKQIHRWITQAKAVSKKTIEQGNGNPDFTLPNMKLLNELGIIKLPSNFKLKEITTTKSEKKKETTKVPPKAKAQVARATFSRVSVVAPKKKIAAPHPNANAPIRPKMKLKMAPKKKIIAPHAKANASIETKKILQTPLTSTQLSSQPTHTSPRREPTAINMPHKQGTSFHSVQNNSLSKLKSIPAQMYPLYSSLLFSGGGRNVESDTSEFPSPQTRITFNRIGQLAHSHDIANPHPSPDTDNRKKNSHPNPSHPSHFMPAASPTLLDTKVAATTGLAAVATTHIPFELPLKFIGL